MEFSDYNTQHIVNTQVPTGVLPPGQPPQPIVNGNAGQPPQQSISFAIPSVENSMPPYPTNHYTTSARMLSRNLPNPSMQFAPGEVHVEGTRPQQGNHQITIHPVPQQARYQAQAVQPQQSYPPSQVTQAYLMTLYFSYLQLPYSTAPPSPMYNSNIMYSAHSFISNNPHPFYYPSVVPQANVYSYFSAQQHGYMNPTVRMNVGYNQNPIIMPAPPAAPQPTAPPTTTAATVIASGLNQQPLQQLTKTRKILSIVDPVTNEVTNKDDIIRLEMEQQLMVQQNADNMESEGFCKVERIVSLEIRQIDSSATGGGGGGGGMSNTSVVAGLIIVLLSDSKLGRIENVKNNNDTWGFISQQCTKHLKYLLNSRQLHIATQ
ncbi:unnamed protein product [Thelazia callipaeda]|uniref:DAZ-associated protein 2 n=1 Tax=Thelazia callipaeda TaxID=103827 RepID=A0A158RAP0_THECL|nr:unnamed protein product [Thelazia callipaeda]